MDFRTGVKAGAAALLGVLVLSGCDGFLVPSGEGEQRPTRSAATPSPAVTPVTPGRPSAPPQAVTPSAGATYSPPVTRECYAGVRVELGEIQAALSHRSAAVTLTNCGNVPYSLSGRPDVRAYAADGRVLDIEVDVREEGKRADAVVMLEPGAVAYSRLDWRPYDGVEKAQALELAAGPGFPARSFPLEGDVQMVDAFDVTPWTLSPPK
ncbi:hypothetical protein GCM10010329_10120 [Streptomyces spiroverticillatus]|uniref:DUF4232 domain-containing protein n=1 Tax=Streptomyces finlayi TaxID=67296 RepID=A0A919CA97_9ACTN|nr:DUF4232 domain-containing protein [Streptomyces finlayi]GGZ91655.1 hypothetical protein GCM10010329_10120 [Streptomyces spiroverticillatus]GHC93646.1 hypothetical protein GCM10010334_30970 [Streptomyces finlayi]